MDWYIMKSLLIPLFILFVSPILALEPFIISYRGVVQDYKLLNENLHIARNINPKHRYFKVLVFSIPNDKYYTDSLKVLQEGKNALLDALMKAKIMLYDEQKINNAYSTKNKTVLLLPATHILVDIKGNLANITVIK